MENNELKNEIQKVADALSGFTSFVGGALDNVVKDAPEEDKEALRAQVNKVKSGDFKEVQDKLKDIGVQLDNLK